MKSRVGAVVNDFRREGSITLLNSLLNYHEGRLSPEILEGMLAMRRLIETETARLAARNRSEAQLDEIRDLVKEEASLKPEDIGNMKELDFRFHHLIAMASGNVIYPLFLNSLKEVYTNLSGAFFADAKVVPAVTDFHGKMFKALVKKDAKASMNIMKQILDHGEERLIAALKE
jgi:DNA-binding FadR family transcriptional regulator